MFKDVLVPLTGRSNVKAALAAAHALLREREDGGGLRELVFAGPTRAAFFEAPTPILLMH